MTEAVDVLIVGAGLSGIGAAVHLMRDCPGKSYVILEAREAIGGTWDLFRYPGIRSDSDMYTLGYVFKPWREAKAIADGPSILNYVRETADEHGVTPHIRFRRKAVAARWSSAEARWTVTIEHVGEGRTSELSCRFLFMCSGYYSYREGYRPEFPGEAAFGGRIVHPQFWPEDLDHAGKRVVVIGSGATAVTIVPEMARTAAKVTMLQRSPTYMASRPAKDPIADFLRRHLPARLAYGLVRAKNVSMGMWFFNLARKKPEKVKAKLIELVSQQLGPGYDVKTHFTPRYNPWDQRLCLVPDNDMFDAIKGGHAEVVTDTIESFTVDGLKLTSGAELPADIVVMATGLKLVALGEMSVEVDGRPVSAADTLSYKGMMYSDVPNLASAFGYTNASWTLKADLTCQYVCRLLKHMDATGADYCVPARRPEDSAELPFLDFSSGYVQRALAHLPKQGALKPWRANHNYAVDLVQLRYGRVDDGVMAFRKAGAVAAAPPVPAERERAAA